MANTRSYSLGPNLSKAETVAGFCWLPFYVALLARGLRFLSDYFGLGLTSLQLNLCYFVINCAVVWIIFHRFLLRSLRDIRFWELVQALILGFVLHYAGSILLSRILQLLQLEVVIYNNQTILELASQNHTVMLICSLLIAPVVEETLVRGLVFGTIRRKSRIIAYAASILFFAFLHIWQYWSSHDPGSVALAALPYVPAGIALGWTYEKANTIWAPILLHAIINAIAFGLMPAL